MSKPHTHTVKTACQYCGVGCGMQLHVAQNRVVKVSGDPTHPANFGRLCTKGLTCAEVLTAPGRLDAAFVRSGRTHVLSRTDLDEGHADRPTTSGDYRSARSRCVGLLRVWSNIIGGPISRQQVSKGFIRTNNIDSNSRSACRAQQAAINSPWRTDRRARIRTSSRVIAFVIGRIWPIVTRSSSCVS